MTLAMLGAGVLPAHATPQDKVFCDVPRDACAELHQPDLLDGWNNHAFTYSVDGWPQTLRVKLCFNHRHGFPIPNWHTHVCNDTGNIDDIISVGATLKPGCQGLDDDYKYYSDHWSDGTHIIRLEGTVYPCGNVTPGE